MTQQEEQLFEKLYTTYKNLVLSGQEQRWFMQSLPIMHDIMMLREQTPSVQEGQKRILREGKEL